MRQWPSVHFLPPLRAWGAEEEAEGEDAAPGACEDQAESRVPVGMLGSCGPPGLPWCFPCGLGALGVAHGYRVGSVADCGHV